MAMKGQHMVRHLFPTADNFPSIDECAVASAGSSWLDILIIIGSLRGASHSPSFYVDDINLNCLGVGGGDKLSLKPVDRNFDGAHLLVCLGAVLCGRLIYPFFLRCHTWLPGWLDVFESQEEELTHSSWQQSNIARCDNRGSDDPDSGVEGKTTAA
ncbi:hypothetical protein RvY_17521 [Ramazzottius varieornatus]|uniref:Uncharacterized protein n=1 Tax=Ramazzottius varieornatus TaxID=947166 RepID=A0A1D1W4K1_RAMVA|nr:hypothetical protein RvY_17521 [Ramazzottius varieornatus]